MKEKRGTSPHDDPDSPVRVFGADQTFRMGPTDGGGFVSAAKTHKGNI